MCPQRRSALILFAVAWSLRIAAVLAVQYYLQYMANPPRQFLIEGDANGYWQLAHQIAEGGPYQIYTPPRQVLRMPGFPLILAVSIKLYGDSLLMARMVLATIGALGCVGIYQLGQRLAGKRVGMIAGWLAAVSPIFIGFSAIELTETAFAVSLVFGMLPLASWVQSRDTRAETCDVHANAARQPEGDADAIWTGIAAGIWAAIGCYLRPSWLLFPPCLVLWLWLLRRTSSRLLLAVVTVVVMVACLVPWGIRNQNVTGHFTLTTLWMGPSLYDGWNMQNTTGDSDMAFFDQENLLSQMSEYEMDREYRHRAWAFAFANPGRVADLAWKKTLRYWNPFPNADQFKTRRSLMAVSMVWYLMVFVPGVVGAWKLRRSLGLLAVTAGPILYFAALHLVFVSSVRYRLPGEYPLLVLSAVGWESLLLGGRFERWLGASTSPETQPKNAPYLPIK